MARKTVIKKVKVEKEAEPVKKSTSFFEYLRFGESYTSLILGIIVVIIATALLLSFVHNKDAGNINTPITQQTQNTVQVSQKVDNLAQKAPSTASDIVATPVPTDTLAPTAIPTAQPKPTVKPKPTASPKPTVHPTAKPTHVIKKIVKPNSSPTIRPTVKPKPTIVAKVIVKAKPTPMLKSAVSSKNVWIVQKGESLWIIAEKKYTSGYNWVDIAKANKLADPGDIHVGDRLVLPNVTPEVSTIATATPTPTVSTNDEQFSSTKRGNNEIVGSAYTVKHGDTMWDIAVRAYGDGYRWPEIVKANNITNPGLIFSGNKLIIPRP
jgi:nucleoid-associated protein YgaU